jgi:NAD+ synthase (glutamine-hydrolysing)
VNMEVAASKMSKVLHQNGFVTVAAASPALRLADPAANAALCVQALEKAAQEGAELVVLPELCLTGYTCGDLFGQRTLLQGALKALGVIAEATQKLGLTCLVGLPLETDGRLFNAAAFVSRGKVLGVIPKTHLPNTGEFYEQRWFASARVAGLREIDLLGARTPFGTDLLFRATDVPDCVVGVELCEDLWAVEPPSGALALAGATLLCNLSASDELLTKAAYRRDLVKSQSARCLAAYVYAAAGAGESSTDVVYSGHGLIAENGVVLGESERFRFDLALIVSQVDVDRLAAERRRNSTFFGTPAPRAVREVRFELGHPAGQTPRLRRRFSQHPFVPSDAQRRDEHCQEIFAIQSTGLARRLRHTGSKHVILGVSGGLDSTLALLVTLEAFGRLGLDRKGIVGVTMPGPGTTARTRLNALKLMETLGVSSREVPIGPAVELHLRDLHHPAGRHDVTFENAQARERTQILMDAANQIGGFVIGTGDLSEAALGWCTFNADHMSMYHVNIGVPKTLVRHLVSWAAHARHVGPERAVLEDIVATPVSPELLPPGADGAIAQQTELIVGPYELHDFFLFHVVRNGFRPAKVLWLAEHAFAGRHDAKELRHWLRTFLTRFFSQQYKRSAMPDGPKVGSVALSPRGDWRMPSDAEAAAWLAELG